MVIDKVNASAKLSSNSAQLEFSLDWNITVWQCVSKWFRKDPIRDSTYLILMYFIDIYEKYETKNDRAPLWLCDYVNC